MKEEEFEEELFKKNMNEGLTIPVYWCADDDNNVCIDFDDMRDIFEQHIKELEELIEDKDELSKIMKEKLKQIGEKKNA